MLLYTDLISRVNNLTDRDEAIAYYQAFLNDPILTKGLKEFLADDAKVSQISVQGYPLDPGSLGLFTIDTNINILSVSKNPFTRQTLEKIMLSLEAYISEPYKIDSLENAAILGCALVQKRKISNSWQDVFSDLVSSMRIKTSKEFNELWQTPLTIAFNLADNKREFLTDILSIEPPEICLGVMLHVLNCLPMLEKEKNLLLSDCIATKNPQFQNLILRLLCKATRHGMATNVASTLVDQYSNFDLSSRGMEAYWQNPEQSVQFALQCQAIADITRIAGKVDLSVMFCDKSIEIMDSLANGCLVKKTAVNGLPLKATRTVPKALADELVYAGGALDTSELPESWSHPINVIKQSEQMKDKGNATIGLAEIKKTLAELDDEQLTRLFIEGPMLLPDWDPSPLVDTLMAISAYPEASRLVKLLLAANPTNVQMNLASAKINETLGDDTEALKNWELVYELGGQDVAISRKLAISYEHNEAFGNAAAILKEIITSGVDPEEFDSIHLAELLLKTENPDEALKVALQILEREPNHSKALTLAGLAHYKKMDFPSAVDYLKKATSSAEIDPRTWLVLSSIQWVGGDRPEALNTLKMGMSANPGEKSIELEYARKLMENGSTAEAYPILLKWSAEGEDLSTDILLFDAMKKLGTEDQESLLEKLVERHPDNSTLKVEWGKNLVKKGFLEKGLTILKEMKIEIIGDVDASMAYVEALLKTDYRYLISKYRPDKKDLFEAAGIVENIFSTQSVNPQAKLLLGEVCLELGLFDEAFSFFGDVLDHKDLNASISKARVEAGFARSAAGSGRREIALAAVQNAIEIEPEWKGLCRVKAEILRLSGSINEGIEIAKGAIDTAEDTPENRVWWIGFLEKSGDIEAARQAIDEALEKFGTNHEVNRKLAEITRDHEGSKQVKDLVVKIITSLVDVDEAENLVAAAGLLEILGESEKAETLLTRAAQTGDVSAKVNLAGYLRKYGRLKDAGEVLTSIEQSSLLGKLLLAEVKITADSNEEAEAILQGMELEVSNNLIDKVFCPSSWNDLLLSDTPVMYLTKTLALRNGLASKGDLSTKTAHSQETGSLEEYLFEIEKAIAVSDEQAYAACFAGLPRKIAHRYNHHIEMLKGEHILDEGSADPSFLGGMEDQTIELEFEPAIIVVRSLAKQGSFSQAEQVFDQVYSSYAKKVDLPYILELGLKRNLIKAASSVNRWKEAITIVDSAITKFKTNTGMKELMLESLVTAIEQHNQAQGLNIQMHSAWVSLDIEKMIAMIDSIAEVSGEDLPEDLMHWKLRAMTGLQPTEANIRKLACVPPSAADAAALMAGLLTTGQRKTAIQVAKRFENDPKVAFNLAQCLAGEDKNRAIEVITLSIEENPNQPLASRFLSFLNEEQGNLQEAALSLEQALDLWPNEVGWHVDTASLWTELGNVDKPLIHLERALFLKPQDMEIRTRLGEAYIAARKPLEAIEQLKVVSDHNPNNVEVWEVLSDAYLLSGKTEEALRMAEKASEVDPFAVRPHIQAGKVHRDMGEIEKAIDEVNLAIKLNPEEPDSYVLAAKLYTFKGEKGKALEALETAAACKKVSVQTLIEHALLLKEINGLAAARDQLEIFTHRFPENSDLLKLLAEAEEEFGNLNGAELTAKRALEINPDGTDLHYLNGKIQEKKGNLDQAAHYFSQAIALDPGAVECYLDLSQVFFKQRDYLKAREVLEGGIRNLPEDVNLHLAFGNLLKDAKDYRSAEVMLRKAAALDPKNVNVHRQLGAILALNLVHQSQEASARQ